LVNILEINKSITANSQGLILSDNAAGSITPKNFNLSFVVLKDHWSVQVFEVFSNVVDSHFNHLQVSALQALHQEPSQD
jgi:hypothetical protein